MGHDRAERGVNLQDTWPWVSQTWPERHHTAIPAQPAAWELEKYELQVPPVQCFYKKTTRVQGCLSTLYSTHTYTHTPSNETRGSQVKYNMDWLQIALAGVCLRGDSEGMHHFTESMSQEGYSG